MKNNPSQFDLRAAEGMRIVTIGGGTGSSTVLRGLTKYTKNITAIVTVADDGGSSGRLRRDFGVLPPGDFRNNIAALSRDEALMTQLLQYRFGSHLSTGNESELKGHAFGNMLIMALVGLTGSFEEALQATKKVLALRGEVFPSTLTPVTLVADIERDGRLIRVEGESAIPKADGRIKQVSLTPEHVRGYPPAIQAILKADLIVIGPGSLYTSIAPNLLVAEIAAALKISQAKRVYVCNVATQKGETERFSARDHYLELTRYVDQAAIDGVLVNDNFSLPTIAENANTVYVEYEDMQQVDVAVYSADLVDNLRPWRHDSDKLARALLSLIC